MDYDIVIVGCGAAGLSAAVSAAQEADHKGWKPKIAVLERAPMEGRGGATQWTNASLSINEDRELDPAWPDIVQRVSGRLADLDYCETLRREVPTTMRFIEQRGVEIVFTPPFIASGMWLDGATAWNSANPAGGGASIVEALARFVEARQESTIHYNTTALRLSTAADGLVDGVVVRGPEGRLERIGARAVIIASGGFEGNPEMLTQYLGARACDLVPIAPGVRNNRGEGIRMAMDVGADTAGQFDMIHAEAVDSRTTKADAVIWSYPFAIVVNEHCERFYDEGAGTLDRTFELIAYEIWRNQHQKAYWIADSQIQRPSRRPRSQSHRPPAGRSGDDRRTRHPAELGPATTRADR